MTEIVSSSETSINNYQATQRNIIEGSHFQRITSDSRERCSSIDAVTKSQDGTAMGLHSRGRAGGEGWMRLQNSLRHTQTGTVSGLWAPPGRKKPVILTRSQQYTKHSATMTILMIVTFLRHFNETNLAPEVHSPEATSETHFDF